MPNQMGFASAITTGLDVPGALNVERAIDELVAQINAQFADLPTGGPLDLGLLFISPHFAPVAARVGRELREALNLERLVGCTAEGVIGGGHEVERQSAMALLAARLPGVEVAPFAIRAREWYKALQSPATLAEFLMPRDDPQLFLILADPFSTPTDPVLATFNTFYNGVPMVGGMASGAERSGENALLLDDQVLTDGAVGLTWSGAFEADLILSQGCRPIGPPLTVTDAERNVILSIENQPPAIHIRDLVAGLSEQDRHLMQTTGLLIGRAVDSRRQEIGRGDFLIRGIISIDRESGALTVGDFVHAGETVQFHLRDAVTAREDLEMMLSPQAFSPPPHGALLFTCNGRGTRLYGHPDGDVSIIQDVLGDVPLAGLFCAGEIGPIGTQNFLHGHTASLVLFRPL